MISVLTFSLLILLIFISFHKENIKNKTLLLRDNETQYNNTHATSPPLYRFTVITKTARSWAQKVDLLRQLNSFALMDCVITWVIVEEPKIETSNYNHVLENLKSRVEKDDDNNFKNLNIVIIYGNYDKSDILEKIRFKVAAGFSGYEK